MQTLKSPFPHAPSSGLFYAGVVGAIAATTASGAVLIVGYGADRIGAALALAIGTGLLLMAPIGVAWLFTRKGNIAPTFFAWALSAAFIWLLVPTFLFSPYLGPLLGLLLGAGPLAVQMAGAWIYLAVADTLEGKRA